MRRTGWGLLPPVSREVQRAILEEGSPGLRILEIAGASHRQSLEANELEVLTRALAEALRQKGHYVDVVLDLPKREGVISWPSLQAGRALRASLRNYDIIHFHGYGFTFSQALVALMSGAGAGIEKAGLVFTYYGGMPDTQNGLRDRILGAALGLSGHWVAASPFSQTELRAEIQPAEVSFIPLGVDIREYVPLDKLAEKQVLFPLIARDVEEVRVVLSALRELPAIQGILMAPASGRSECVVPDEGELPENVRVLFTETEDEEREWLGRSHVVILAGSGHPLPTTIWALKAMACGCVLVGPDDLPAVRRFLDARGFVFPAGDAEGLRTVLDQLDPDRTHRYAHLGRQRAERWGWDDMVQAYHQLLTRLHLRRLIRVALRGTRSAEDLRRTLLLHALNMVGADGGAFFDMAEDGTLTLEAVHGRGVIPPRRVERYSGVYGFAADQKSLMLLPDDIEGTYLEDEWHVSDLRRSGALVPVRDGEQLVGLVEIVRSVRQPPFDETYRTWLSWWGQEAGAALGELSRRRRTGRGGE